MPKPTAASIKNLDLGDNWSSHPAVEWLLHNKQTFIWVFLGLIVILIAATRFAAMSTLKAENDFFQAQHAFAQFQKEELTADNEDATEHLEELEAIMTRHPEIKPKYEGALAQALILTGNHSEAQKFADDIFKRTKPDHLGYYQDYSRTSLLISEGHYNEALPLALQLKVSLEGQGANENPILYVYNLIRIAMLYQQTNQPTEELKSWEELESLEAVAAADQVFTIGQASLNQYIEQRKKALNK